MYVNLPITKLLIDIFAAIYWTEIITLSELLCGALLYRVDPGSGTPFCKIYLRSGISSVLFVKRVYGEGPNLYFLKYVFTECGPISSSRTIAERTPAFSAIHNLLFLSSVAWEWQSQHICMVRVSQTFDNMTSFVSGAAWSRARFRNFKLRQSSTPSSIDKQLTGRLYTSSLTNPARCFSDRVFGIKFLAASTSKNFQRISPYIGGRESCRIHPHLLTLRLAYVLYNRCT